MMKTLPLLTLLICCALYSFMGSTPGQCAPPPTEEIVDASFLETQPVIKKQSKVRFSKKGITGEVVLRFVVTKDGKVDKIDIVSFNDSDFIDAAYETYEYTKYTPGTVNGVAVATRLQVTLTFPAK